MFMVLFYSFVINFLWKIYSRRGTVGLSVRPYGRMDRHTGKQTDEQTDMTKLIVAFRHFANVSKNGELFYTHLGLEVGTIQ
jgi:hypothetical protein